MRKLLALVVVLSAVLLSACGKGTAEINLASVGETMTYDQTAFTVKAGQKVHVVLTNHATSQVMKHNWVLVNPGKEAEVATAGMTAGESKNYVQPGDGNVLAHTPISQPGGQTEVTFTAPPAGTYPFICTYPGHYQTMHGTLTVTP
ncbi:MAG TPA: plastocyanin/azurin family copper-binding protein [Polyangiaceae bacterium]|jgi:azurin|nr:plastocyanin/azurin family copper-binding protein [Polyangiaceae bacterium]